MCYCWCIFYKIQLYFDWIYYDWQEKAMLLKFHWPCVSDIDCIIFISYLCKFTFVILGNFKGGNGKIWNFCQYPPVSGFMFDVVGSWCILCVWLSLCNVSCAKLWSLVWGSQYCWSCSPAHLSHSLVVNSWCCRHLIELCNILITLHCSSFAWLST